MTFRRLPVLLATGAAILAATWLPIAPPDPLPPCQAGDRAPTQAPTSTPSLTAHNICRARVTLIQPVRDASPLPASAPQDPGPYAHLGATTVGSWSGVMGRLQVRDPGVRPGTYDFTGARFMARRDLRPGHTAWIEAGWAETGWSEAGRQRVYTYDTNRDAWTFYDDYDIHDGDQIWIYLETEETGPRPTWSAWLWWGAEWHLLSSQDLPLTGSARIEEYVEIHSDAREPSGYRVPAITIDNVRLKTGPDGPLTSWRDPVVTSPGGDSGGYCVDWQARFDTWRAGTCPHPVIARYGP